MDGSTFTKSPTYWGKRKESGEDPRVPTVEHAKNLEMIKEAVQKLRQNTGVPNAKLVVPRFHRFKVILIGG